MPQPPFVELTVPLPVRSVASGFPRYSRWAIFLMPAIVFAIMGPAVACFEFANGIEDLHVATVLEIRRGGPWIVPNLDGRPRLAKPPLPAWIGSLCVTDATMAAIASPDPAVRARGYTWLAWQIRWPTLLAGCLMLLATADLGTTLAGRRAGLLAGIIAGSCLLFLNYYRIATTDTYLTLWVAVGNALLARAALRGQLWRGVIGAGAALGLAIMSKGPVSIVQSVVPLAVWWLVVKQWTSPKAGLETEPADAPQPPGSSMRGAAKVVFVVLAGIAVLLLIAAPWPIYVLRNIPKAYDLWRKELLRDAATGHDANPPWAYLNFLTNLLPWLPMFVLGVDLTLPLRQSRSGSGGFASAVRRLRAHRGYTYALCLVVVPIAIMICFQDRQDRYLLPMIPAAAVLAARGLIEVLAGLHLNKRSAKIVLGLQLGIVAAAAIALPLAGTMRGLAQKIDHKPWYGPVQGSIAIAIAVAGTVVLFVVARRRPVHAIALAALMTVATAAFLLWGYKDSTGGRDEMKPIAERIRTMRPGARVSYYDAMNEPKPIPPDLPIYLDQPVPTLTKTTIAQVDVPDADRPDVIVMLQREDGPPPALSGWRSFAREPYKKRFWHAMERVVGP